ncbi:hypothetical protein BH23PLA1_BH23PLA1_02310 [soil metagenome]
MGRLLLRIIVSPLLVPAFAMQILASAMFHLDARMQRKVETFQARNIVLRGLEQPGGLPAEPSILACLDRRDVQERRIGPKTIAGEWTLQMGWSTLLDPQDGQRYELVVDGWAADTEEPEAPRTLVALRHGQPVDFRYVQVERPDIAEAMGIRAPMAGFLALIPCRRLEDGDAVRLYLVSHGKGRSKVQEFPMSPPDPVE